MQAIPAIDAASCDAGESGRRGLTRRLGGGLRRFGWRDVAPLGLLSVTSIAGTALAPALHQDGMLLALLSPRLVFLGVAAHQNATVPFVVLATLRLCLADPFHYRIGRRHGADVLNRFGRVGRWMNRWGSHSWFVLGLVAVRPIGRHLMWAGTKRMNPVMIGAVDLVSTALFCVAVKTGVDLLPLP